MRKAGSGTGPMREWAAPSYDPNTGRAASAYGDRQPVTIEGERISPNRQMPNLRASRAREARASRSWMLRVAPTTRRSTKGPWVSASWEASSRPAPAPRRDSVPTATARTPMTGGSGPLAANRKLTSDLCAKTR